MLAKKPLLQSSEAAIEKTYNPHIVVVWTSTGVAVKEFPYEEDAVEKFNEIRSLHLKVTLAKVIRSHGEG